MSKIFCIGECALDIMFDAAQQPLGTRPAGCIANVATLLAKAGNVVAMASEASTDPVGDMVVRHLVDAGVDVHSVDRFNDGSTPANLCFESHDGTPLHIVRYRKYPAQRFDIVWPNITAGDIVVFGGYYVIDPDVQERLTLLLHNASERGATMIYVPGFGRDMVPRITRYMPTILENLELAHIVVTRTPDLANIFGIDDPHQCFNDHVNFYCRSLVNIDPQCNTITYYAGAQKTMAEVPGNRTDALMWNAGIVAGMVQFILSEHITPDELDGANQGIRTDMLKSAVDAANNAYAQILVDWQRNH